jgi:hypothetical protein
MLRQLSHPATHQRTNSHRANVGEGAIGARPRACSGACPSRLTWGVRYLMTQERAYLIII